MVEKESKENGPAAFSETSKAPRPWLMRTYSGHSSAIASNALYRTNLKRGQTGLSVAFDLPTQTGYDADHPLARGEVGKVGVPISHLGDMRALFADIPLEKMNTSMTINATAPWLLALYIALAEERGVDSAMLQGTVQNDIIKEYLSRGTYIFPPEPSLRLIRDVVVHCAAHLPKWNPTNVCSYHLQEAGATPEEELAFALATAIAVLDCVRACEAIAPDDFPRIVGRISFFVNAGIRFVTEMCKMRAFVELWDEITRQRYGVEDPTFRRFRYGVQVNSLGLTEQQPENNVYRILLETLSVVLSKNARARAVQLPAWNEAMGLPREWDQQWSLRLQQILAYETDLLEFGDLFDGSPVVAEKVETLKSGALAELAKIEAMGGAVAAVENGYMKRRLVQSNSRRLHAIEEGTQKVVGVNIYTDSAPSPLVSTSESAVLTVDASAEKVQIANLHAWRESRDQQAVDRALEALKAAAASQDNIMPPSILAAKAGATTGEWAAALREVYGKFRAPTGVGGEAQAAGEPVAAIRARVEHLAKKLGRRPKFLVGKPGLDGHSNGAEQIAAAARDCGFDVVYEGIRLTPARIVNTALEEGVHVIGLSVLSGSHLVLVEDVIDRMHKAGMQAVPLVLGGIIPAQDAKRLTKAGVARVFTPKDFKLTAIMEEICTLLDESV
ncbi:protein meaA [Iodidimonas gelatinilytica]|nr:protein meaA [Iodidimonas gelatinilytica]